MSETMSHEFPLAVGLLWLYILLGHGVEQLQRSWEGYLCLHESGPAIALGVLVGLLLQARYGEQVPFDPKIFFYFVLPPIIFAQGYTLKRRAFFRYFHYIALYGVLGTLLQFMLLALSAWGLSAAGAIVVHGGGGDPATVRLTPAECVMLAAVLCGSDEVASLSLLPTRRFPKVGAVVFGEGVLNDALSIVFFDLFRRNSLTECGAKCEFEAILDKHF